MLLTIRPYEPERLCANPWGELEFSLDEGAPPITARWLLLVSSVGELLCGLADLCASPTEKVFVFAGTGDPFTLRFEKRKAGRVEVRHGKAVVVLDFRECIAAVLAGCAPLVSVVGNTPSNAERESDAEERAHLHAAFARLEAALALQV